ncbi:hypothetical protein IFT97_07995 [Xanthomonas campestris]|nr:hypothetical protein [Xanthomonas campestris]
MLSGAGRRAGQAELVEHGHLVAWIAADGIDAHAGNKLDGRRAAELTATVQELHTVVPVCAGMARGDFDQQAIGVLRPRAQHAGIETIAGRTGEVAAAALPDGHRIQRGGAIGCAVTRDAGVYPCIDRLHLGNGAALRAGAHKRGRAVADPAMRSQQRRAGLVGNVGAVLGQAQAEQAALLAGHRQRAGIGLL